MVDACKGNLIVGGKIKPMKAKTGARGSDNAGKKATSESADHDNWHAPDVAAGAPTALMASGW